MAICVEKFSHPAYPPPLKRFPLAFGTGAGVKKLERCGYRANKKVWLYLLPWNATYQSDRRTNRRTDRQTDTGRQQRPRLRIASSSNNAITEPLESWLRTLEIKPKPINIFIRCKLQTAFILVIENSNCTSPIIITITQTLMTITYN